MAQRSYQILDVRLRLESSVPAFLDGFQANYFRFECADGGAEPGLCFRFEQEAAGCFLEADGVREDLAGHPHPQDFAAQRLAQLAVDRVRAFTVLHAGVVAADRGALAIAGPSGAGKTTLTLALLETGLGYMSDDFCPLHRDTGLVHPFPRSLWVRAGQGDQASGRGKTIVPLDGRAVAVESRPRPLAWLVCLEGAPEAPDPVDQVGVALRPGRERPFLDAVAAVPGAELRRPQGDWPEIWLIRYPRSGSAAVRELLRQHRDACWNAIALAGTRPDFTREPALVRIPPVQAAFFLLRELRHSLLDRDLPDAMAPGALLAHLGTLLAGVACYRLTPGPLARRLALVRGVLDGEYPDDPNPAP